ncbi:MAG: hypothetical protein OXF66_05565 [Gammaproteobacteria bacterium]|nr:hypothetical protein [Gammaproteobacteria bacterium]
MIGVITGLVIAAGGHILWENQKMQDYSYSWEKDQSRLTTWEESKHILKYMPSLSPNSDGLLLLDDGTFVPRAYFDMPPALRFIVPVRHQGL